MKILKGKKTDEIIYKIDNDLKNHKESVHSLWYKCIDYEFILGLKYLIKKFNGKFLYNDIEFEEFHSSNSDSNLNFYNIYRIVFKNYFGIGGLVYLSLKYKDE